MSAAGAFVFNFRTEIFSHGERRSGLPLRRWRYPTGRPFLHSLSDTDYLPPEQLQNTSDGLDAIQLKRSHF